MRTTLAIDDDVLAAAREFWPDGLTLLDETHIHLAHLSDATQVPATYLLALARAHGGRLATFDRHLVTNTVVDGAQALSLIG